MDTGTALRQRDLQAEVMDDPEIAEDLHEEALAGLARLNRASGVAGAIFRRLKTSFRVPAGRPLKVLDVATGGGDIPVALARAARRERWPLEIAACDKSETALRFARRKSLRAGAAVHFFRFELGAEPLPAGYDVLISSLFLHHLTNEMTVLFLQEMARAARRGVLLTDLRRSRFGLLITRFIVPLLTRSAVVKADAVQSLRAAYTVPEIKALAAQAGLPDADLRAAWPSRYELLWMKK